MKKDKEDKEHKETGSNSISRGWKWRWKWKVKPQTWKWIWKRKLLTRLKSHPLFKQPYILRYRILLYTMINLHSKYSKKMEIGNIRRGRKKAMANTKEQIIRPSKYSFMEWHSEINLNLEDSKLGTSNMVLLRPAMLTLDLPIDVVIDLYEYYVSWLPWIYSQNNQIHRH